MILPFYAKHSKWLSAGQDSSPVTLLNLLFIFVAKT